MAEDTGWLVIKKSALSYALLSICIYFCTITAYRFFCSMMIFAKQRNQCLQRFSLTSYPGWLNSVLILQGNLPLSFFTVAIISPIIGYIPNNGIHSNPADIDTQLPSE
jgi:hypothetical protein